MMDVDPEAHYKRCLKNGCSPKMAEMLASRVAPKTRGLNRSFMEKFRAGHVDGLEGVHEREMFYRMAKAAGVSVAGKYYQHDLADYWGDPNGWVSDLDEVADKCRAQNRSCEGALTIKAAEAPPQKAVRLAPQLVEEELENRLEANPDLRAHPEKWDAEREAIIEQHGGFMDDIGNVAGTN